MRSGDRKMSATAESSRSSDVLHAELPAGMCCRPRSDERKPAEVLHLRQRGHALEQARHDRRGDAEVLTAPHDAQQHLVRRGRERDHDLLDLEARDRVVEIPARAGHRNAELVAGVDERLLVEERDRPEAELGVVEEALGDERADAPGSDDERRPHALPLDAGPLLRPVPREAPRADVRERESPQPYGLGGEVGGGAEQDAPREDEHRRERRGRRGSS